MGACTCVFEACIGREHWEEQEVEDWMLQSPGQPSQSRRHRTGCKVVQRPERRLEHLQLLALLSQLLPKLQGALQSAVIWHSSSAAPT